MRHPIRATHCRFLIAPVLAAITPIHDAAQAPRFYYATPPAD